ncbi:MAG TPA: hypothetical protein VEC56_11965 [Candidatus Krumholzibacteria bacterium]|nr:hypothetical protein [Candidatus Krumholzibacteria bacterium]
MKTIDRPKRRWLLGAALVATFGLFMGACGNDEEGSPTDVTNSQPIQITDIIASPKSADPGDTLLLSAIVTSTSPNVGDVPSMEWTATGGAFLEDNQTSVRWIAPASGVYTVTARARNTVSSATGSADLFVGGSATVVTSLAGAITLKANQSDFYYLRTGNNVVTQGTDVWQVVSGTAGDAVTLPAATTGTNSRRVAYAPDLSFQVHSSDSIVIGLTTSPVHLYLGDFATSTYRRISSGTPSGDRYPGFTDAAVAPDNHSIAFGAMLPTPLAAGADTFDIVVYDNAGPTRRNLTAAHTNHRNVFPTWSTDQRWLAFISDRSGRGQWDLYGMPINTLGVINTAQASLVRLSNTSGRLADGDPGQLTFVSPPYEWNPAVPTLAVRDADGILHLIITTPAGATQIDVGAVNGFAWSPDGSLLALALPGLVATIGSDGTGFVYRVGRDDDGNATRPDDNFNDISWSPDGGWIVYRATRASSSWLEVYDVDQSTIVDPIALTPAEPTASLAWSLPVYRVLMSMKPAWGTAGVMYYPTFGTGAATVGIRSVDVSGLTP